MTAMISPAWPPVGPDWTARTGRPAAGEDGDGVAAGRAVWAAVDGAAGAVLKAQGAAHRAGADGPRGLSGRERWPEENGGDDLSTGLPLASRPMTALALPESGDPS